MRAGSCRSRPGLCGRSDEQAELGALIAAARAGRSGSTLLLGDPGLGKTALLDATTAIAADFLVLRTSGVESETAIPFGGLHRLLRPVAHRRSTLPPSQVAPLEAALGLGGAVDADRFLLCAAVLSLLCELARDVPVLCRVDDAHWLDQPSLDALAFAARRLDAEGVVLLFAAREQHGEHDAPLLPGIPALRLSPLDAVASGELVAALAGDQLPEPVRDRVLRTAAGNPQALVELVETAAARGAGATGPVTLPAGSALLRAHRALVARLPAATQRLLLLVAADDEVDVDTLVRAAATEGLDVSALEPAERAGLLHMRGDVVRLRSPLIGSAIYQGAPLARRRAVHAALARALTDDVHRVRRAWHRAMAASGPDDGLADELCRAAAVARRRGDYPASCLAFERAAQLRTSGDAKARDLIAGAGDARLAGDTDRARALLRAALPLATSAPTRGRAELLRGDLELRDGDALEARRTLLEAAETLAPHDRRLAVRALMRAGQASSFAGDLAAYAGIARRAARLRRPDDPPRLTLIFDYFAGTVAASRGDHRTARAAFGRVVRVGRELDESSALTWASVAALLYGDAMGARTLAARAVAMARARGGIASLPQALAALVYAELCTAQYLSALPNAVEGLRLAEQTGQRNCATEHLAALALLAAVAGDEQTCRSRARAAGTRATAHGLGLAASLTVWAEAFLDQSRGDSSAAALRLRTLARPGAGPTHFVVRVLTVPHFVEAAVRSGNAAAARRALVGFDAFARASGYGEWLALSARSHALLADGEDAAREYFREALRLHATGHSDFERARTELLYGNALRRRRRPARAREHLHSALETFERFGARLWCDQTRAELRATGEAVPPVAQPVAKQLTPQQLQIARFVAEGKTNREVAAQLFVSPRTVDHHLRNIFTRLGIRSRLELVRMLG
ncbi:AAA ATPase domain-containing protein [Micromonospora pattaloongensis]|uniref:AAA ATPase domain-containing protein n=1 Tax=Micromonospora pattaloongensis TaxID=405436 RepID=A0A1H3NUH4_9ACTN|nr:LuxR family transcriptional regulator [Micromonospora pattaloongensis]SDY92373.1 AAA ATPase domain-containing protein [Micromonospora pattaloongensis]